MKKQIMILAVLAFSLTTQAKDFDCSSSESYPVNVAGYIKSKNRNVPRTVFTIVNPDPSQESTYLKAFDIGNYRFVKNNASKNGWDVYRTNATSKVFELIKDYEEPIRIFDKEAIYVSMRSRDSLFIRRNGDEVSKKEMLISTTREKITVRSLDQNTFVHYPIDKCIKGKAAVPAAAAKDGQAKP